MEGEIPGDDEHLEGLQHEQVLYNRHLYGEEPVEDGGPRQVTAERDGADPTHHAE